MGVCARCVVFDYSVTAAIRKKTPRMSGRFLCGAIIIGIESGYEMPCDVPNEVELELTSYAGF